MIKRILARAVVVIAVSILFVPLVIAEFTNGGFEDTPDLTGWTVSTNINQSIITPLPTIVDSLPLSQLNLQSGGSNLTTIGSGGSPESSTDSILGTHASFRFPRYGSKSAIVNLNGSSRNVNTLQQTYTTTTNDVDPVDGKVHVRFVALPVLESGGHPAHQQPYYFIQVENVTKSTVLYHTFKYAAESGVPWQTYGSYYYTDWQYIDIAPGFADLDVGDQVKLKVVAAGCSQGGHAGWVYVDGVGSFLPGLSAVATAATAINDDSDLTYTITYRNGGTGSADHATITQPIPANTTFVSVSAPGASCTTPSVGASSGNIVCDVGTVTANGGGSFTVTVHVNSGATGLVSNGSYAIAATGISSLIGPLAQTSITHAISYADLDVSVSDGIAAVAWGQAVSYSITVTNHGPAAANAANVVDSLPAQLTGATWTCTSTGGAACGTSSGSGDINLTTGVFPSGGSITITLTAHVIAGSGTGSVAHRVDIIPPGGVTDNSPLNDYSIDTDAIGTLRTLTINKSSAGASSILSVPSVVNCDASCSVASGSFVDGSSVTLTSIVNSPYTFAGWSGGGCSGTGACTFTITGDTAITATYTGGPTATPTPTATQTPTVVNTNTPTVTPTSTPTVSTPSVLPPTTGGGDTTDRTPTITGTGSIGQTVNVYVDGLLSGTAVVGSDGQWSYTFTTGLSLGNHEVTVRAVDANGTISAPTVVNIGISGDSELDFNGDGSTEIATWKHSGDHITYAFRGTDENSWKYYRTLGIFPAPGDYDGDGKWDTAAISIKKHQLIWNIPSGTAKPITSITFGKEGDTVISGCKLLGTDKNSLGIFRERERQIFAREKDSTKKTVGLVLNVKDANLLGCADVDGDKIDELIFQVPGTSSEKHGILVVSLSGKQKSYKDVGTFTRGLVVRRVGGALPLVGTVRNLESGKKGIEFTSISGDFKFPTVTLPKEVSMAAGVFVRSGQDSQPALFWSDIKGNVSRRYLVRGSTDEKLFKIPTDLRLIRAQNFTRSADFRN